MQDILRFGNWINSFQEFTNMTCILLGTGDSSEHDKYGTWLSYSNHLMSSYFKKQENPCNTIILYNAIKPLSVYPRYNLYMYTCEGKY